MSLVNHNIINILKFKTPFIKLFAKIVLFIEKNILFFIFTKLFLSEKIIVFLFYFRLFNHDVGLYGCVERDGGFATGVAINYSTKILQNYFSLTHFRKTAR